MAPASRTATRAAPSVGSQPPAPGHPEDAPATPADHDLPDEPAGDDAQDLDPDAADLLSPSDLEDDTTDFYRVVNDDHEIMENARHLESGPPDDDHSMMALMDVLQVLGINAEWPKRLAWCCRNWLAN